jgi:hypothetical protein
MLQAAAASLEEAAAAPSGCQLTHRQHRLAAVFLRFVEAAELMALASPRPLNVGLQTCVDYMVKTEQQLLPPSPPPPSQAPPRRTRSADAVDAVRTATMDGYSRAIKQLITRAEIDVPAVAGWAVPECYRMAERFGALCEAGLDYERSDEMWRGMMSWCVGGGGSSTAVPSSTCGSVVGVVTLVGGAAALQLGMARLGREGGAEAAALPPLLQAAQLLGEAAGACFRDNHHRAGGEVDGPDRAPTPPPEYFALLRMVVRGGALLKLKDCALEIAQSCATGTDSSGGGDDSAGSKLELLATLEALLLRLAELIDAGSAWEQQQQQRRRQQGGGAPSLPPKFGRLMQTRLAALHGAYLLRAELGIRQSAPPPLPPSEGTGRATQSKAKGKGKGKSKAKVKMPTKTELAKRAALGQASIVTALQHLQHAADLAVGISDGASEGSEKRSIASFSYNAAIRLSSCECYHNAVTALKMSCTLLQQCSDGEETHVALCARYSLMAKCYVKTGQLDTAAGTVHSGIVAAAAAAAAVVAELSASPGLRAVKAVLTPLVQQYTSVHLQQLQDYATAAAAPADVAPRGKGCKKKAGAGSKAKLAAAPPSLLERLAAWRNENNGGDLSSLQVGLILETYLETLQAVGPMCFP